MNVLDLKGMMQEQIIHELKLEVQRLMAVKMEMERDLRLLQGECARVKSKLLQKRDGHD